MKECVTHHYACDCREEKTRTLVRDMIGYFFLIHNEMEKAMYDEFVERAIELGYVKEGEL